MTRVVVLGSTGMLGSAVYAHFLRVPGILVVGTTRGSVARDDWGVWYYDATVDPSIRRFVGAGDVVVNCIGAIRQKPFPIARSIYLNAFLPHVLAKDCWDAGAALIHVSTDCVFSGDDGPYDETDGTTAEDIYGRGKALGEPDGCLVIRTSIIGRHQSSRDGLVEWFLSQRGRVDGYTNHIWNGVTTGEFAKAVESVVRMGLYATGVRHVHSEDVTKFEVLCALRRRYGTPSVVVPVPSGKAVDRRLRTIHPGFLGQLGIRTFREMISDLP